MPLRTIARRGKKVRQIYAQPLALRKRTRSQARLLKQDIANYLPRRDRFIDSLGERYAAAHSPAARRKRGITLTPPVLVDRMIELAGCGGIEVARVVDPGAGTGRFAIAAARAFPNASIVAIENDRELAGLLLDNLCAARLGKRTQVLVADFREIALPPVEGATLFIGNPPYVRHHDIDTRWKHWYSSRLATRGIRGTQLAGLHAHFLVKTIDLARDGDLVCYVTASEWLDTEYGRALRELLLQQGRNVQLVLLNRNALAFDDAMTTSVVSSFRVLKGEPSLSISEIESPEDLAKNPAHFPIPFAELAGADGWSKLAARGIAKNDYSGILLGDLFSVHRGQVTGNNSIWIEGGYQGGLPESVLFPAITRAKELLSLESDRLLDDSRLKRVIDLPDDWAQASQSDAEQIERFIAWAKREGARNSYIARHRSPWFKVRLRYPAPIIVTYMARRPPKFVRNLCGARLVNIAHGLYPRESIQTRELDMITAWLNVNVSRHDGRTYAGGLTKFEPREVERLRLPSLDALMGGALLR